MINRAVWYYLDISGLFLAAMALSAAGCLWLGGLVGLLVRLTCHIPDVDDLFPSSTVSPSFTTLRWVAMKVAMHLSLYSCPIYMRSPDSTWGKAWAVRAAWFKRGFRLKSALWVACIMIPSSRMIWELLLIF